MTGQPIPRPWPGETPTIPARVNGKRLVAAVKLATRPGQFAHQWAIVVEATGDTFTVFTLVYHDGQYTTHSGSGAWVEYGRAVQAMIERVTL